MSRCFASGLAVIFNRQMAERYEIRGKLGSGGIGAVYRAFDTVMGREVAIKRLLPLEQTKLNDSADASLKREAAALARLSHPNILTIYAFEEDSDGPYVVTELVDGENLKVTIERGALPVNDFEGIVEQTLEPMIAAHAQDLLHRDIKPANIMLHWLATGRFQIKILDFGLAKFSQQPSLQTLDQTGSFLGSIDYIAPEQIDLKPLDARTDLYSLGCVYYYALTQRPPFEADTPAMTMRYHLDHIVTPIHEIRSDLPTAIADFVMRLIARDPSDRPDTASQALREFVDARNGISPVAAPSTIAEVATVQADTGARSETAPTGPQTATGKTLLTGAAATSATATSRQRSARSAARVNTATQRKSDRTRTNQPPAKSIKVPLILLVIAILITAMVLPKVLRMASPDAASPGTAAAPRSASVSDQLATESRNKLKAHSSAIPEIPRPLQLAASPEHAQSLPPRLPKAGAPGAFRTAIVDGLVGHYHAGALTYREDLVTPAKPGDAVAAWGNLASDQDYHYLARVNGIEDHIPTLELSDATQAASLNGRHPVLSFHKDEGLRTRIAGDASFGLDRQQLSTFVVCRVDKPGGHIVRFDGNNKRWNYLILMSQQDRFLLSLRNLEQKSRTNAPVDSPLGQWIILSALWDAKAGSKSLRLTQSSGKREVSTAVASTTDPTDIIGYVAGTPNKLDANAKSPQFSGQIAEILIYSRSLDDAETVQVEDHLVQRYFKK